MIRRKPAVDIERVRLDLMGVQAAAAVLAQCFASTDGSLRMDYLHIRRHILNPLEHIMAALEGVKA